MSDSNQEGIPAPARILPGQQFGQWIPVGSQHDAFPSPDSLPLVDHGQTRGLIWLCEDSLLVGTAQAPLCLRLALLAHGEHLTLGYFLEGAPRAGTRMLSLRLDFDVDGKNLATIQGHGRVDLGEVPERFHPLPHDMLQPGKMLSQRALTLDQVQIRVSCTLEEDA